ncbi:cadmium-translocating P-type ATPase [Bacteroides sp. OttesenSCG-928-J23]|nr:cadmium-translocating P-type ATPase [Bacteroides sp. OttesenSCG-928-J23]MDL2304475.1 cadmium-translocating P-type ATPase [Bacteroides sp. OttesenSCG-928-D19]
MSKSQESNSNHSACHCCHTTGQRKYLPAITSFILLAAGLMMDVFLKGGFFQGSVRIVWYAVAYMPVGIPVIREAFETIAHKDFFNEFTLMVVATLGAFFIGEYPEGVAVMLFYSVGELFQEAAVNKAQGNIKALLDVRPDTASVFRQGKYVMVEPESVGIGETIQVKAGEKVSLDGTLLSPVGSFNTSALTGESVPRTIRKDEPVLAGMLNLDKVIEVCVNKKYEDSSLAKILEMVQNATSRKAKTELLIRKFARVYTPVVFFLAVAITILPMLFVSNYVFADWLYRALVFLVISCPCALVISVPLSYFSGIGAASRAGVLFKGANFLEKITRVNTVVMDKTGTLTEGVFKVQQVVAAQSGNEHRITEYAAILESYSNHPIAKAIVEYCPQAFRQNHTANDVEELAGYGLKGMVDGHLVMLGNSKLAEHYGLQYDNQLDSLSATTVLVFIDNAYAGYLAISDQLKADAPSAIQALHKLGIRKTIMLSGDKSAITLEVARTLSIDEAYGDLLPEDKVSHIERLKADATNVVAFVGDGINDAPVLALSDVGIAMGGMGSDAAIEVADVVIQTDQPSKIATAISIAKATRRIVFQNIALAITVKLCVLLMGAMGVATMWEAVFADVGVSLLAILNAVRVFHVAKSV